MGNELIINLKVNADGSVAIQQVTGQLSGLRDSAGTTGNALTTLSAQAQTAGESIKQALMFAGVTVSLGALIYKMKEFYNSVMEVGSRVETLKASMYAVGQNFQVSGSSLDYYVNQLKNMGVASEKSYYAVTQFLKSGLNLEQLEALAQTAKNLAPTIGKSFNEVFQGLIEAVGTGMPRALKQYGIQTAEIIGMAKKSLKELDDEMTMTGPERSQAVLKYALEYGEKVKSVGEAVADSYAKQLTKLELETNRFKEALFEIFEPIARAITGEKIKAWEDLYGVIVRNKEALINCGEAVAVYVGDLAQSVGTVLIFAGTHTELFKSLLELYGFYKVAGWIVAYTSAAQAATTANIALSAAQTTAAATSALAATAQTAAGVAAGAAAPLILYEANAYGVVTKQTILAAPAIAGAGAAAASSGTMAASAIAGWTGLAGGIKMAVIALAAYGVYKTFTEPGQLTGPTASGDPFADIAAGARDKDLTARGPITVPNPQQQYAQLEASERAKEAQRAVEKALAQALAGMPTGSGKGGGGGGGAGGKSPEEEMADIVKRLEDAITHASLERAAAIEKEYSNWLAKIKEVGAADEQTQQAMVTAGRWRTVQMDKIEKELTKMIIQETEDRYTKLGLEEDELRKKMVDGVKDPALVKRFEDQINQIMGSKMEKLSQERIKSISGLWKQYFDVLAQGDPYSEKTWTARWSRLELEHRDRLRNLTDLAKQFRFSEQEMDQGRRNTDAMYYADAKKLAEEQMQYMGGMYQGMTKAATDYYNESTNLYKQGVTLFNQTTAATETALAGFFEIIIFRTGNFTDVMTNFLKQLANALIKSLIIQPLVGLISGGLGSLFGGGANSILGGLAGNIGGLIGLGGEGQDSVINTAANAPAAGAAMPSAGGYGGGGGGGNAWLGLLGVGGIGLMAAMMGSNEKGSGSSGTGSTGTGTGGSLEKCTVKQMLVEQLVTGGLSGGLGGGLGGGSSLGQEGAATVLSGIIKSGNFKGFMADWANAQALENLTVDTAYLGSVEISNLQNLGQFVREAGDLWVGSVEDSTSLIEAAGDRLRKNIEDGGMSFQQAAAETGKMLLANLVTAWGQYVPKGPGDYGTGNGGILNLNPLSWFHAGGVIRAHSGMVLGEDERLVIGQVEEGILPAASMRRLGRRNFESLRTGDFGQVRLPGSQAGESGPKDMHVHVHVHALDPNSVSTLNWERIVEGKIAPALKKLKREWVSG